MTAKPGQMYFYHAVGGEMVMDQADHTDHLRQHHQNNKLQEPKLIAGTFEPMSDKLAQQYAEGQGLKWNAGKRSALPAFVEPAHWSGIRARNEAARAKKERGS